LAYFNKPALAGALKEKLIILCKSRHIIEEALLSDKMTVSANRFRR